MKYFVSDLDKTLIYSKQNINDLICVEVKEREKITYMTNKAYIHLIKLLNNYKIQFIPCTLRSFEQTIRIKFIKEKMPKYMICDNGRSIYINGILDDIWENIMKEKINENDIINLYNNLINHIKKNNLINVKIKENRNSFITLIFDDEKNVLVNDFLPYINDLYNVFNIGRKVYIIPKIIDKSFALKYLIDNYGFNEIITSGDSEVDFKFVNLGTTKIIPKHAKFKINNSIITKNDNVLAGEEILLYINNFIMY